MRVIAGSKRSIRLFAVEGNHTRPTTDRIKETIFNVIAADIPSCDFLDLYAGSGQIGIEALSRGAKYCAFCENDHRAISIIGKNLAKTGFMHQSDIFAFSASIALAKMRDRDLSFDIIYMDPPYELCEEKKILMQIDEADILNHNGYIIIEADINRDFSFVEDIGFEILKIKKYKTNQHIFIGRT